VLPQTDDIATVLINRMPQQHLDYCLTHPCTGSVQIAAQVDLG